MNDKLERNKKNAEQFYHLAFNECKPEEAVKKFVGDKYIQHNPTVKDGKEAFIEYFNNLAKEYPGKEVHFKKIIAEGDYVVFHCYQIWPGDSDYASVDIFRLDENGKVVEHWDVLQAVPEKSVNQNSMF